MIGIIDYGSGNVLAIANVYKRLNIPFLIINKEEDFEKVDKLILPGVGAFDEVMGTLNESGLKSILHEQVTGGKPVLGVCVGMQILGNHSDEGELNGFGWIDGEVKKFDISKIKQKPLIPHLGWNSLEFVKNGSILDGIEKDVGFYFIHTYYFSCNNEEDILATTHYGEEFTSAVQSGHVFGVQFHPEKSHENGIIVFENFANWK